MDVTNGTGDDAKVKVSGSGAGAESKGRRWTETDVKSWTELPRGQSLRPKLKGKPPWRVYFYIKGNGRSVSGEVPQGYDQVTLVWSNGHSNKYRVKVEKKRS